MKNENKYEEEEKWEKRLGWVRNSSREKQKGEGRVETK